MPVVSVVAFVVWLLFAAVAIAGITLVTVACQHRWPYGWTVVAAWVASSGVAAGAAAFLVGLVPLMLAAVFFLLLGSDGEGSSFPLPRFEKRDAIAPATMATLGLLWVVGVAASLLAAPLRSIPARLVMVLTVAGGAGAWLVPIGLAARAATRDGWLFLAPYAVVFGLCELGLLLLLGLTLVPKRAPRV